LLAPLSPLTALSSRVLSNFQPCYNATAVQRLLDAGAVPVGKTVMDEFGMGSFTLNEEKVRFETMFLLFAPARLTSAQARAAQTPTTPPKSLEAAAAAALLPSLMLSCASPSAATRAAACDFQPHTVKSLASSRATAASAATVS